MSTTSSTTAPLIGRTKEYDQVLKALSTRSPAIIYGVGGIGKTILARKLAEQYQSVGYSLVWVTANDEAVGAGHTLVDFDSFVTQVVREAGRPGLDKVPLNERLAQLQQVFHDQNTLVVIDSMDLMPFEPKAILDFARSISNPSVCLITTRELPSMGGESIDSVSSFRLRDLQFEEMRSLMLVRAEELNQPLNEIPDEMVWEIFNTVGGHPLLLSWIVAQHSLTRQNFREILRTIPQNEGTVLVLSKVFGRSFNRLDTNAQQVLLALTTFGAPASELALADVADLKRERLDESLNKLIPLSLVEKSREDVDGNCGFSLHPLTREFASQILRRSPDLNDKLHIRLVDWLIKLANACSIQASAPEFRQFKSEIPNIVSVAEWCLQNEKPEKLIDLVSATHHLMWELGYRIEENRLCRDGFSNALQMERYDVAWRLAYDIGWTECRQGRPDLAGDWANRVERILDDHPHLEISARVADHLRAQIRLTLGETKARAFESLGKKGEADLVRDEAADKARGLLKSALQAFSDANIKREVAFAKTHLGEMALARGSLDEAQDWFQQILTDVRPALPKDILSWTWGNLGDVLYLQGDAASAEEFYSAGLKLADQIGREITIAHCKKGLAAIEMQRGSLEEALKLAMDALDIYERQYARQRIEEVRRFLVTLDRLMKQSLDKPIELPSGRLTEPKQRLSVFLCYSSMDQLQVVELYKRLATLEGLDVWYDKEKLLPGQVWEKEIRKAERNADVVIVCLSKAAIRATGFVQKEISAALDAMQERPEDEIFLIPLRFESCEVPERLSFWQWVDYFESDGYERLSLALSQRRASIRN